MVSPPLILDQTLLCGDEIRSFADISKKGEVGWTEPWAQTGHQFNREGYSSVTAGTTYTEHFYICAGLKRSKLCVCHRVCVCVSVFADIVANVLVVSHCLLMSAIQH